MNLGALKPPAGSRKKRKRVGRGGDHGGTSCKGNKGQNARSGGGVRPSFEGGQMPITRRLPKRGFHNQFRRIIGIVNVGQLEQFSQGTIIDEELLLTSGLIKRRVEAVKILGNGDVGHALSVKVAMISKSARDKIINAGGSIIEVN